MFQNCELLMENCVWLPTGNETYTVVPSAYSCALNTPSTSFLNPLAGFKQSWQRKRSLSLRKTGSEEGVRPELQAALTERRFQLSRPCPTRQGQSPRSAHAASNHLLVQTGRTKCGACIRIPLWEAVSSPGGTKQRSEREENHFPATQQRAHPGNDRRRAGLCCQPNAALCRCQQGHLDPAQFALPELPARVPKDALVLIWQDSSIKIRRHLAKNKNGPVSREKPYPIPLQKPTTHTAAQRRWKERFWESSCWAQRSLQINRRLRRSVRPTLPWKAGTRHHPLPSSFVSWCERSSWNKNAKVTLNLQHQQLVKNSRRPQGRIWPVNCLSLLGTWNRWLRVTG